MAYLISNIIIYFLIFAMGTVFGSFFTLAVYRLPLKKDITHERSFCPNCNHRLEFLDLIPVLSYIFLKGKCRYCGNKIRPRYLMLELLSGTVFLVSYISYNIGYPFINIKHLIEFGFFIFTYITIVIISFIDREYHYIHLGTLIFGLIFAIINVIYDYYVCYTFVLWRGIAILSTIVCIIISKIYFNKKKKHLYIIEILSYFGYLLFYLNTKYTIYIIVFAISACMLEFEYLLLPSAKEKDKAKVEKIKGNKITPIAFFNNVPMGFYLGLSTIVAYMVDNIMFYYFN